jgi:hypothetical protein
VSLALRATHPFFTWITIKPSTTGGFDGSSQRNVIICSLSATEKAMGCAGGKIADSMSKPIWEALEEKAKWLAGRDATAKH